jgi:hypothetical protein
MRNRIASSSGACIRCQRVAGAQIEACMGLARHGKKNGKN